MKKTWILLVCVIGVAAVFVAASVLVFGEMPSDKENSASIAADVCQQPTGELLDSDVQTTIQQPTEKVPDSDVQTTIYFKNENTYMVISENSAVTMIDILENLQYDKNKMCKCMAEYDVKTELGIVYGINFTAGYARCDKGQAELTQAQIDLLKELIFNEK